MSGISTHILDTAAGRPASGVPVHLFREEEKVASAVTNEDGRVPSLLPLDTPLASGRYRILFDVGAHWSEAFYPEVSVTFPGEESGIALPHTFTHQPIRVHYISRELIMAELKFDTYGKTSVRLTYVDRTRCPP